MSKMKERNVKAKRKRRRFPWRAFERRYALLLLSDMERDSQMYHEAMELESKRRKVEYLR